MPVEARNERARVVCIPVRFDGEVVAVLTREAPLVVGRRAGELERVYVGVFDRFARMVTAGTFPFPVDEPLSSEAPRVGDGVMTLDAAARVEFASPNAVNAMHRLGVYRAILGASLDELGVRGNPVPAAYAGQVPGLRGAGARGRSRVHTLYPPPRPGADHRRRSTGAGRYRPAAEGPSPDGQGRGHP